MSEASGGPAALKTGDLVLLDYEIWADGADHADLVDTTRDDVARKADAKIPEGQTLEPRPHLVGGEYFPKGIEDSLVGAKVGEVVKKEFAPAEAFGERDPKLIELFSRNEIARLPEMRKEDAELGLGTVLTIRGRRGRVVTLTAGRIRVDFNPELAGRRIRAELKPLKLIDGAVDRARAVVELTYGHGKDFDVSVKEGIVTLKVPERTKFDLSWAVAKPRLIEQLRAHLTPKAIHIVEEYVTPAAGGGGTTPAPAKGASGAKAKAPAPPAKDASG